MKKDRGPTFGGALKLVVLGLAPLMFVAMLAYAATTVPTDVMMPGTQSGELPTTITSSSNCGCHDFVPDGYVEESPFKGWSGGMMANAGRDPLFWATVAVAEQDFDGVGDLCIKCHSVKGWVEGRSTPTNGSGLDPNTDEEGIMCEFCHLIVDPDMDDTMPPVADSKANYSETQFPPFEAYDPVTGDGYYGGAEYVLNGEGDRLGPFAADTAKHTWIQSPYHRDANLCGTCHDVSNPAVGDLAPNHGSIAPFTGVSSYDFPPIGAPNVGGLVDEKAALNNEPHTYGIVERTFSEFLASDIDTTAVSDFATLPADLQVTGGALQIAHEAALHGACSVTTGQLCNEDADCPGGETCVTTSTDYEDGQTRYFICQTCHMRPAYGKAANQGDFRTDLPLHDQTGFSIWISEAIEWQNANGTLLLGDGYSAGQSIAFGQGRARAAAHLSSAASLTAVQPMGSPELTVRVTNLTGHKLISGYPEGRRMWLQLKWYDGPGGTGSLIAENGAYGPLGNVVQDLDGDPFDVESIIDKDSTKIYEAEPAMTQDWAAILVSLGYDTALPLTYDRYSNLPDYTLGDLATESPGDMHHTFHFVLNNAVEHDNRIPPYRMEYALAYERNAVPIPQEQYGDPTLGGNGGVYNHWDDVPYTIPSGAQSVTVRLLYQVTSWEYIQFLWLGNHGSDSPDDPPLGDPFLGLEGVHMLDAWLNTGMAAPYEMQATTVDLTPVSVNPPGDASGPTENQMTVTAYDPGTDAISLQYTPACDASGHTIHYLNMNDINTYTWADADCTFGTGPTGTFIPDPAVGESIIWVIVGQNVSWEGSYGWDSSSVERPPNTAAAGACYRDQSLAQICE
jgi:hypothetical protein